MSSALANAVTLEDVLTVVASRRVPIAPELVGYLALEVADSGLAADQDVDPKAVVVSEEGTVAILAGRGSRSGEPGDADASLRALLARLLEASGSQTPALAAAARKTSQQNVSALMEELEAALIPVNRAAGRRALARLAREVRRVTSGIGRNASKPPAAAAPPAARPLPQLAPPPPPARERDGRAAKPPSAPALRAEPVSLLAPAVKPTAASLQGTGFDLGKEDIDTLLKTFEVSDEKADGEVARDLKRMAGLDPTPPPPGSQTLDELLADPPTRADAGVESLLAMTSVPPPGPTTGPSGADDSDAVDALLGSAEEAEALLRASQPPVRRSSVPAPLATHAQAPQPSRPDLKISVSVPAPQPVAPPGRPVEFTPKRAPKTGMLLAAAMLVTFGVGLVAVYVTHPEFLTGRKVAPTSSNSAIATAPSTVAPADNACRMALVVKDAPVDAEILIRLGQAPLDVPRLPVGTRIEFVATAEGYAPKRAVVVEGAIWDKGADGKPRLDVPAELPLSKAKPGAVDPWPPAEAGTKVGGTGEPGTVHIVSSPRGAEIWLLAGLGPEGRYEPLPCDAPAEVLVAGPTTYRKRIRITPEQISQGSQGSTKNSRVVTVSVSQAQ
jgi:hypothetical protein